MMKRALFTILQVLWGFPQTLAGFMLFLAYVHYPHANFHGAIVTRWPRESSVSLGLFIFVSGNIVEPKRFLRIASHEYGHCIQSLILGPFYLLVIGLPSFLWAMIPAARRWRTRNAYDYYRFFTERSADYLSARVLH